MLSVNCEEVWVDPIKVSSKDNIESILKFIKSKRPIVMEKGGAIVSEHLALLADPMHKISSVAVKVPAIDATSPVFIAAQNMLKYDVMAVPVKSGKVQKYLTHHSVIGALKSTRQYARREARVIMRPIPVVSERNTNKAAVTASKNDVRALPVVNSSGKLISVWSSGSITKKPNFVKEGTRLKIIANKISKGPVVVVNNHREPVGLIDVHELLEMAAMYREFSAPIYFSGFDVIAGSTRKKIEDLVTETTKKIADIAPLIHTSVYLRKRGVWSAKIKVSTKWRTFIRFKEGSDLMNVFTQSLNGIFREIRVEKKKKVERRELSK